MKNKKEKLKELLSRLDALQKGSSLDSVEISKVTDTLIEEEISNVTAKLQGNPTIKILQRFNTELAKFKRDFDLKPIIDSIKSLGSEISASEQAVTSDFKEKVKDLIKSGDLNKGLDSLRAEFEKKVEGLSKISESFKGDIELQLQTLLESSISSEEEVKKELLTLRKDVMARISSLGGGSMNQQINVNSSVMSLKFADINFVSDTAIKWSATDDNVNKRVNIRASVIAGGTGSGGTPSVGGAITGGIDKDVLFVHPSSIIAQDSNFQWDTANGQLKIGSATGFVATTNTLIQGGGTVNTYLQEYFQNASTGTSASTDLIVGADNDGVALTGHYMDMGVNGSGWTKGANPTFNIETANAAYLVGSGGDLFLETDQTNIVFATQGYTTTNETARLTTGGLTLGLSGTNSGKLLLPGKTSGTVTATVASVAGTWTMVLPPNSGSANQVLTTDGNGITTWATAGASSVVSGITRLSSIISTSGNAGATNLVDYAYFANVGLKLTLPTAIGNTNLYTVKNVSTSSVLIATTSAQTIDGSTTALIPLQNQSVDLLSDNANWNVV